MDNKKNGIPKLRFPGFTGAWEQRKLGEVMDVGSVKRIHQSDWKTEGVRFLRARDIVSFSKNEKPSDLLYIDNSKYNEYSKISGKVQKGDLLVTGVGSIGVPMLIKSNDPIYFKDGNIIWFKNNNSLNGNFFYYSFTSNKIQNFIRKSSGAGTVGTYTIDNGKKTPILIPKNIDEQEKVGKFLSRFDALIALHQRKLEHLQEQKKGLLQKMFPKNGETVPEVRFPGFTDAWEQRKWVDSINISNEMVDPTTGKFDDMPHIAPGNIESFTGRILDNVKTVKEEELISGKFLFKPGDVVFGKINPQLGKYFYARVEGLTSADSYVLNGKNKNITQMFIFLLLQTRDFFKYSVSVSKRSGIPKINREELNGFKFLIPCKEEQEKIGDFFLNIDSLIALHQRKLEHLELMKKGLLQQMFV